MDAKMKLNALKSENPDPTKWSKWLKFIIAVLSALVGAITENLTNVL